VLLTWIDNLENNLYALIAQLDSFNLNLNVFFHLYVDRFLLLFENVNRAELSTASMSSFILISVAEMGDKSQLVCMTLASRYRAKPVLLGAISAFVLLNTVAVVFGVAIAGWFPDYVVAATVALLFAAFGIHSLRQNEEDEAEFVKEKSVHSIFLTTFLLITVAEFGDKTQLAVVALSSTIMPIGVWIGSIFALIFTSALGILVGHTLLAKLSLVLLHKISGGIFLILSVLSLYKCYISYMI
jgi:putative Ca2+/H+ antiporter (TMEM165/GDT1 family)